MSDFPGPSKFGKTGATKNLKGFGFGLAGLKRYPELIPIVVVVSCAVTGGLWFIGHNLTTKQDISLFRGDSGCVKTEWENVKPTEKHKSLEKATVWRSVVSNPPKSTLPQLMVVHPHMYKPIREVEDIKREIGSYKR